MPGLDWDYFPHVRDAILEFVLEDKHNGTIHALRLTQRAVRDFLDRRLVRHVVYTLQPRHFYTLVGKVQLRFVDPHVAARVRVLDVRPGSRPHNGIANCPPCVQFPCVRYARVFCRKGASALAPLVKGASDLTVIYAVPFSENLPDTSPIIGSHKFQPSRSIALLPIRRSDSVWDSYTIPAPQSEPVLAFVQSDSGPSTPHEVRPEYRTIEELHLRGLRLSELHLSELCVRFYPDKKRQFILAGSSNPTGQRQWAGMIRFRHLSVRYYSGDNLDFRRDRMPDVTRISWSEWWDELTCEEQELIQHLPEVL